MFYGIIFILTMFVPADFLAIAFDYGGVTTGPMTVPFIMSFGVGIAAIRSDRHAEDNCIYCFKNKRKECNYESNYGKGWIKF